MVPWKRMVSLEPRLSVPDFVSQLWYPCPLCENSEFDTTVMEHIMEYHKPNLNLEKNWTVGKLMKTLRELNISVVAD